MVVTLPAGYKLLSGGGGSTEGKGQYIAESYPSYDEASKRWSWRLKLRVDIKPEGAKFKGVRVSVIALEDPKNEWDVALFSSQAADMSPAHKWSVSPALGYVITGGGAKISWFDRPALSGCGFTPETIAEGGSFDAFSAKSNHVRTPDEEKSNSYYQDHKLTAYAIGVKARNGVALQPRYSCLKIEKKQHPEGAVTYSQASPDNSFMLGGGVWVTGDKNFFSASYPDIDARTGYCTWVARSQDRHIAAAEEMMLVAIGLDGVNSTIRNESSNPGNKWEVKKNENMKEDRA
jgi:hypothetical protein